MNRTELLIIIGFYASNGYRLSNGDTWQHYDEEGIKYSF